MRVENTTRIPDRWRYGILAAAILSGAVSALIWFIAGEGIPTVILYVTGAVFLAVGYLLLVLWKRGEWKGGA